MVHIRHSKGHRQLQEKRIFYHTIHEAVMSIPGLKKALEDAGADEAYLLRRLHVVDKNLVWGSRHMKGWLNDAQKEDRVKSADDIVELIEGHPEGWLDEVIWIDEVKIWLYSGSGKTIRVWWDAHCKEVGIVVPGVGLAGHNTKKAFQIHMYVAVCGKLGYVAHQYTSGTTDFPQKWLPEAFPHLPGYQDRRDPDYKVRRHKHYNGVVWNSRLPQFESVKGHKRMPASCSRLPIACGHLSKSR